MAAEPAPPGAKAGGRAWSADGVFRTVLKNAAYLGSTKLVGAGLGLVALSLAGRSLGPAVFGVLVVVHAYATGAGAIAKFQTWQLIIARGAPALHRGDTGEAREVIRFAFGLDILSGLVGMAAAMAALPLLAGRFGLVGGGLWLALGYCTLVPTMSAATATGVLRVLDRFDLLGAQQIVTPALRAAGAVASFAGGFGFTGFVVTWYVADLAGDLVLWAFAVAELRRRGLLDALRPGLFATARRLPGAWSFVWTTNAAHSLYAAWGPVANLVVAAVLGPAGAGLYKVASTLLDSAVKPADLLRRGFYPEIMRLDPASRRPWRLGVRIGVIAGGVGLLIALAVQLGGGPVIALAFGRRFLPAADLLRLMTWSLAVSLATFPLESLLYMVGRQGAALRAQVVAAAVYLTLLAALTHAFGLAGAGAAYLLGSLVTAACMLQPTVASYLRRERHHQPGLAA